MTEDQKENTQPDSQMSLDLANWSFELNNKPFDDEFISKQHIHSPTSDFDQYMDSYSDYGNNMTESMNTVKDLDIVSTDYFVEAPKTPPEDSIEISLQSKPTPRSIQSSKRANRHSMLEYGSNANLHETVTQNTYTIQSSQLNMLGISIEESQPSFEVSQDMQQMTVTPATVARYSSLFQKSNTTSDQDKTMTQNDIKKEEKEEEQTAKYVASKPKQENVEMNAPLLPPAPPTGAKLGQPFTVRANRSNSIVTQAPPMSPSKGPSPSKISKIGMSPSKHRRNRHGGSATAVALALQSGVISTDVYLPPSTPSSHSIASPSHAFAPPLSPMSAPSPLALGDPHSQLQSIHSSPIRPHSGQRIHRHRHSLSTSSSYGGSESLKQKLFEAKDPSNNKQMTPKQQHSDAFSPSNLDPFEHTPEATTAKQFSNSATPNLSSDANSQNANNTGSNHGSTNANALGAPFTGQPESPTKPQRTPQTQNKASFKNSPQPNNNIIAPAPPVNTMTTVPIPMSVSMPLAPPPPISVTTAGGYMFPGSHRSSPVPFAITPQQPLGPPPISRRQQFLQKGAGHSKSKSVCVSSMNTEKVEESSGSKSDSEDKKSSVGENRKKKTSPVHLNGPPTSYLIQQQQQMTAMAAPMYTGGYTMEELGIISVQNPAYFEQLKQAHPMISSLLNGTVPINSVYPMTNYPAEYYQQMQPGMPYYSAPMNIMPNGEIVPADGSKPSLAWQPVVTTPFNNEAQNIIKVQQERPHHQPVMHTSNRKSCLPPGKVDEYITGPDENGQFLCLYPNCGKLFKRRYNVRSHIQTHLCDRPYVCKVCSATFVRPHDLRRHEMSHQEEKPFVCPCGKSFTRPDALQRHRIRMICSGGIEIPGKPKKPPGKRGRPKKKPENDDDPSSTLSGRESGSNDKKRMSEYSDNDYDDDDDDEDQSQSDLVYSQPNDSPTKGMQQYVPSASNNPSPVKQEPFPATSVFKPNQVGSSPSHHVASSELKPSLPSKLSTSTTLPTEGYSNQHTNDQQQLQQHEEQQQQQQQQHYHEQQQQQQQHHHEQQQQPQHVVQQQFVVSPVVMQQFQDQQQTPIMYQQPQFQQQHIMYNVHPQLAMTISSPDLAMGSQVSHLAQVSAQAMYGIHSNQQQQQQQIHIQNIDDGTIQMIAPVQMDNNNLQPRMVDTMSTQ